MKNVSIFIILIAFLLPLPSFAFNQNYIISDKELENYDSMTAEEIQEFLLERNSFLAYFADFYPDDNTFSTAADIIWKTAQKFYINPKFILALLEKEQSLISIQKPAIKRLDWAMGYAVCDKCNLSHPLVAQFKGFGKQVYYAINKLRNSFMADIEQKGSTKTGFGPKIIKALSRSVKITPVNKATAALYTYTPHVAGNKSLYLIWKKWFSDIKYPDGSLLQDIKTGGVYLIKNGEKQPISSKEVLTSRFNKNWIIQVTTDHLLKYSSGKSIKFADNELLQDDKKNIYLTYGDEIMPFDSSETPKALGFGSSDIEKISSSDLSNYSLGQTITATSTYVTGSFLQHEKTGGVYWVMNGVKYPIQDKSILKSRFPNAKSTRVSDSILENLKTGDPIKFADGTLVKNRDNPSVYFVSGGILLPVPSEDVFLTYGWNWNSVLSAPKEILSSYEIGAPIILIEDIQSSNEEAGAEEGGGDGSPEAYASENILTSTN